MQLLIDLLRAVKGLSRLFRFDASYVGYFDKSIQGTWRSFFAMMLVAPILALSLPADLSKIYPNASEFEYLAVRYLLYVINWFTMPLAVLEIGRRLKRGEEMPSYITIYNWLQLISLPLAVLFWTAVAIGGNELGYLVYWLTLAVYFIYVFYLSRSFLRLENHAAALFVIADLAVYLVLDLVEHLALTL
jgi:hypothetical protein